MSWTETVERLSQYDKKKWPPGSREDPPKVLPKKGPMVPQEDVDRIITRLTQYDATKCPPSSRLHRKELPFNTYNYDLSPDPDRGRKLPMSKIDEIVERLYREEIKLGRKSTKDDVRESMGKTCTSADIDALFERLQKVDFGKGPPESRAARVDLGFYRYAYGVPDPNTLHQSVKVPKEKMDEIIQRLSTYDITKYPPGSNGPRDKR